MTNKYKWKTIIGVIGVWLHNHPNQKKHNIEFHTDELEYIKKALTPPTADEVCKALSEYYKWEVSYSNERHNHMFYFEESKLGVLRLLNNGVYFIQSDYHKTNALPPHLITLIGRFYEGLEKVGKEE